MKRKFYIKLIIIGCLFLGIGIFNYIIDPGNYFQKNNYQNLGKAKDKNILLLSNIDERKFKKNLIEKLEKNIDILILGSSRVMTIGVENFKDKKVFNSGVSGAGLGDILALLNVSEKEKIGFSTILLGIDPWLFNIADDKRYRGIENEYLEMLEKLSRKEREDNKEKNLEKIKYLFKISTLKDSIKNLKNISNKNNFILLDKNIIEREEGNIFLAEDRSLKYPNKFIRENNGNWKTYLGYQMYGDKELNKEKKEIFEKLIKYCKDRKIELIFYLPPYNPKNYEYLSQYRKSDYEQLNRVEEYIKEIAEKNNIKLLGSYNDQRLDNYDFYDGIHMKREKIKEYYNF